MKLIHWMLAVAITLPVAANAAVSLSSTADGKSITIPAEHIDTPAAKEFLNSGKNAYIGKADAVKAGKKIFQLYSCTACHGAHGEGAVGPNLIDDKWNYAKNAQDQGIFETIWAGTAAGMGAKGKGLMQPDDPSQGLTPDEVLKVVAFIRSNAAGAAKPVEEKAAEAKPAVESATASPEATTATATAGATAAATTAKKSVKKATKKRKAVKKTS